MIYGFIIITVNLVLFLILIRALLIVRKGQKKLEETKPKTVVEGEDLSKPFIEETTHDSIPQITDRKKIDERLLYLASIVESADEAIIGKTLEGQIVSWNKGAEHLYGYKAGEVINRSISIIFPPELRGELPKILERLRRGEHIDNYRTVRMDKNSKRIPVLTSISPVISEEGKIIGASSITHDITQEKELDELKDEFISLTSHALRTPLSAIKGLISMIYQGDYGPMNKNLEKPLSSISISAERLIQIVNDLLNITKVQTGKLEFKLTEFSIREPIQKVVEQLSILAKKNGVELRFVEKKVGQVQGDLEKTIDILNNLVSNALKFTNKGFIEVSLEEKFDMIVVNVKDTGMGIADKDKSKLFQKFQQIANPTTKQISGTGLGLYLSKALAQKMGGDVWLAQSELKKGSTFTFSLPKSGSQRAGEAKISLKIGTNLS